uniref:Uncharacterized protein n=1 Tax=Arundo donax TaxID=35708 RepID=A0A0A8ZZI9_ARUDO
MHQNNCLVRSQTLETLQTTNLITTLMPKACHHTGIDQK